MKLLPRSRLLLGFLLSWPLVGPAWSAEPALQRFTYTEPHMGTRFRLTLCAPDEATARKASQAAFQRVAELDGIMSDYRATSEIMQLCKKAGGDPVPVSPELFTVLESAQEVARRTDGAFDVTIGPVVRLWRLARRTQRLPPPDELAAARSLVGWQLMKLDPKARTVQLTKPGMLLDLGGIGKGYTADEVLAVLRKHNITSALIAAGGDVAVGDPPPGEPGWRVGIAPLDNPDKEPTRFLLLKNYAVSTSGDSEQFAVIDGKRYSHIVDPKTGLGLLGSMSVTVIAPRGITSDSLDTAIRVLGPEKGMKLIEETPGAAGLIVHEHDQNLEVIPSNRFPDFAFPESKKQ